MKVNPSVSSDRRKNRARYFQQNSLDRSKSMCITLSQELREKHLIRTLPVRRDDTVKIVRGKNQVTGKVIAVARAQNIIHVQNVNRVKKSGESIPIPVHPSNCVLTELKMTATRLDLFKNIAQHKSMEKGKFVEEDVE
ncbi:hypothetical protein PCE1_004346 [Barthelona sp. PCE]